MNKLLELLFINSFKGIGKKTIHRKYIDAIWRCEDIYDLIGTYLPMIKVFSNADIDQAKTTAQRHIEELEEMQRVSAITYFDDLYPEAVKAFGSLTKQFDYYNGTFDEAKYYIAGTISK